MYSVGIIIKLPVIFEMKIKGEVSLYRETKKNIAKTSLWFGIASLICTGIFFIPTVLQFAFGIFFFFGAFLLSFVGIVLTIISFFKEKKKMSIVSVIINGAVLIVFILLSIAAAHMPSAY